MFALYRGHAADAESLIERLEDLTRSPEELSAEAESLRKKIRADRESAESILAKPPVAKAVALPSSKALQSRLTTRARVIDAALGSLASKSLADLRPLADTARKLHQDARDADQLANVSDSIAPALEKIDNICLNTTKAGKEDANEGDGSSEAAAIKEAQTGRPIKGKAHGPKCKMEAKGLRDAIKVLQDLRSLTTDPGVHQRIDAGITKATTRAAGLDTGAAAWDSRVAHDPDGRIWHPSGESKVEPGFGKGI